MNDPVSLLARKAALREDLTYYELMVQRAGAELQRYHDEIARVRAWLREVEAVLDLTKKQDE